ncbi:hypothetical protein OG992_04015 [Micromonospora sp. NBC_00362]|uniref:hypothetical protein n=1 Tax=Micromonospora sp. NBC_00362 TaxID=2975975 RepID=UPI00225349EB|nr:hypothetical protein [Micromonospora sp. NBC_00362]MCX5116329.1 hypothetical protein [Micromonospora sp. NBC_00362]
MPPRRRPRSWLAGRLRSAAGAVQRLAGRVEPAGQLPPSTQTPVVAPRRFGEPPRHWLDLVAAHAPGLLHDLELDPSPTGIAEVGAHSDGQGGSTGRVDADGADPAANARPGRSGRSSRSDGSGRSSRSGRLGNEGDAGGSGASGTPSSGSDLTTPPAGSTWPHASRPPAGSTWSVRPSAEVPPERRTTRLDTTNPDTTNPDTTALDPTAADASELPRSDGPRQPIPSMVFGQHSSPSVRPHRAEAEVTRTTSHPPLEALWSGEVDHWRSADSSPVRPTADRLSGGRDGFRGDGDGQPSPREDPSGHLRGDAPSAARSPGVDAVVAHRPVSRSNRDGIDPAWTGYTATSAGNPSTSAHGDLDRLADGGPWLALPGEPARPRPPAPPRDAGTGTASGGRAPGIDGPPPSAVARSVDPWPALPDDTALWSVAGTAVDTAQLTRLDREQAAD